MIRFKNIALLGTGLAARLLVVILSSLSLQEEYYAPFLNNLEFQADPWKNWIESGGNVSAFPYGIYMLIAHIPGILISKILSLSGIISCDPQLILNICLILLLDILITLSIREHGKVSQYLVYWLSPAVIFVNYSLGSNDILPSFFILMSGIQLLKHRAGLSGTLLGIAAGMKFSLVLLVPFLVIYLIDNPRYRSIIRNHISYFLLIFSISYLPAVYSADFRKMVFSNPEISKFLTFNIPMGYANLVVFPLIYIGFMYWLWRAGRTSLQTLIIFLSSVLIALSFVNLSAMGWVLWGLPLLILSTEMTSKANLILQTLFPMAMVSAVISKNEIGKKYFGFEFTESTSSLTFTFALSLLIIFLISTLRHSINYGDIYKLGKKPVVIAISGDSGTGKSKLSLALSEFFGKEFVSEICGDDYHKFERNSEVWNRATHLNPAANNVGLWVSNLKLARQRKIFSHKHYDHTSGIFSFNKSTKPADLIISQGLHAGYAEFRESVDLFVHLEVEDSLREKMKIVRDTIERGKTAKEVSDSLNSRKQDSELFINLQRNDADLVIRLSEGGSNKSSFLLQVSTKDFDGVPKLSDVLRRNRIFDFDVHVNDQQRQVLTISQDVIRGERAVEILRAELESFDQLFVGEPSINDSESATAIMFIFLATDWKLLNK